jgi:excinuclease UvrABC ATPase subunit
MALLAIDRDRTPAHLPFTSQANECPNCNGAKKVWVEQDGQGPWKGKELVDCPICDGKGYL